MMKKDNILSPEVIHLHTTTSTNIHLRELIGKRELPEGSVVWTDFQSKGRGQMGNGWESKKGENLLFSTVLYPDVIAANKQFLLSQITALSIQETLSLYTDEVKIKWPNDIYRGDRKICGMLIENDLVGMTIYCSVIGVGININQKVFESDAPNPISLTQITGHVYDREEILQQFLSRFYHYYLLLLQEQEEYIHSSYLSVLYRKDGFHRYEDVNGTFEAIVEEVEPTGHLILRLLSGEVRKYAFKEVKFLI